jgi:adenylate cyclase
VLGRFGEDIDAALALVERALALNPSFAYGWYWSGWLRLFAGQADLAIQHFETSMRLNPRDRLRFARDSLLEEGGFELVVPL